MLREDDGETVLKAGDAAAWKAGVAERPLHHQPVRSRRRHLEVGTRAPTERAHYSDIDMMVVRDGTTVRVYAEKRRALLRT